MPACCVSLAAPDARPSPASAAQLTPVVYLRHLPRRLFLVALNREVTVDREDFTYPIDRQKMVSLLLLTLLKT